MRWTRTLSIPKQPDRNLEGWRSFSQADYSGTPVTLRFPASRTMQSEAGMHANTAESGTNSDPGSNSISRRGTDI